MNTLAAAAMLPLLMAVPSYAAESGVSVRLGEVKGAVSARASSSAAWAAAADGAMLAPGSEVNTGAGATAVLAFSDGNKVKLEPGTTFGVEGATTLKTSLRLFSGKIAAWVKRANKADFTVRHAAGVAAVRGTIFTVESGALEVKIALYDGLLDIVDNFGRPSTMSPRQSAHLSPDAGLMGISSLPPAAQTPEEPKTTPPPPPGTTAAAPPPADAPPPEALPSADKTALPPPSPIQESRTTTVPACVSTVSPSAPCP